MGKGLRVREFCLCSCDGRAIDVWQGTEQGSVVDGEIDRGGFDRTQGISNEKGDALIAHSEHGGIELEHLTFTKADQAPEPPPLEDQRTGAVESTWATSWMASPVSYTVRSLAGRMIGSIVPWMIWA